MNRKQSTYDNILEAALQTFLLKGFQETNMATIAKASGLARRTLYRYFISKEDLAYHVVINILREYNAYQQTCFNKLEGKGIQQVELFLHSIIDYYAEHKEILCLLGEFDYFCRDDNKINPSDDVLEKFHEIAHVSENLIQILIEKGLQDGSITLEYPLHTMVLTITNVLWGFGQRAALREDAIQREFKIDPMELITCQLNLYIDSLKA